MPLKCKKKKRGAAIQATKRIRIIISWTFALANLPCAMAVESYFPTLDRKEAVKLLPPPPLSGSQEEKLDREIFRSTRKMAGSPRWAAARSDNSRAIHALLSKFSCGVGVRIKEHSYPELSVLLFRTIAAGEAVVKEVKSEYRRPRPFQIESGPVCLAFAQQRLSDFDYPSGHATSGWLAGLLLAELWPARSPQILDRAREYGESRVICGVHSLSSTEGAQTLARSLFKVIQKSEAFRRDYQKAEVEINGKRNSRELPDAEQCQEQDKVLSIGPRAK